MLSIAEKLFRRQRQSSKQRRIEFKLTFGEWLGWWEVNLGPDWMRKRGKSAHQFVMARLGDKGAYELSNIKCITNIANFTANCNQEHQKRIVKLAALALRKSRYAR